MDHVLYSCYMLLFFNSDFHCGTKLTVHKIYVSKLLLWNNRNSSLWNNRNSATVEQWQQCHCGTIVTVSLWNNRNSAPVDSAAV